MSTLNFENEPALPTKSTLPLVLRTILITLLGAAALAGSGFGGYYYAKNRETISKLDTLQSDVSEIKKEIKRSYGVSSAQDEIKRRVDDVASKLDDLETAVKHIKSSTDSIESDVSSIQSDVTTLESRIRY